MANGQWLRALFLEVLADDKGRIVDILCATAFKAFMSLGVWKRGMPERAEPFIILSSLPLNQPTSSTIIAIPTGIIIFSTVVFTFFSLNYPTLYFVFLL